MRIRGRARDPDRTRALSRVSPPNANDREVIRMSEIPTIQRMRCTEALTARYWAQVKSVQRGWLLITNAHPAARLRVHFGGGGNDGDNYKVVKPLHSKPFQVDEGDQIWISSAVANAEVVIENSIYKPTIDEYYTDEAAVENVPVYADGVAATTTYDCTTLIKGYATQFQVGNDVNFVGTVEYSSDNAVTYSAPVTMDVANPLKRLFQELDRVVTHVRVTRTGGTFWIYYR